MTSQDSDILITFPTDKAREDESGIDYNKEVEELLYLAWNQEKLVKSKRRSDMSGRMKFRQIHNLSKTHSEEPKNSEDWLDDIWKEYFNPCEFINSTTDLYEDSWKFSFPSSNFPEKGNCLANTNELKSFYEEVQTDELLRDKQIEDLSYFLN